MKHDVSVIGLGTMGSTLARLALRGGHRVTVWNRSRAKADALAREGAIPADTVAGAVAASPVLVVCVHDYSAANQILDRREVDPVLAGRALVQLTTGSPQEARDAELWAWERDAEYIDGAIQAAPSQMGRPDTTILASGAAVAFRRAEPVLRDFGGNAKYLGEQVGAASTTDLAPLSYVYGAVLGFLHGARVAEAEGFPVDPYGSLVAQIAPSFGEFLRHEGAVIHSGDFRVSESPLKIPAEATRRLAQAAREAGINAEFPAFAADLFRRGMEAGYGEEEAAALIKVLRGSPGEARRGVA